MDERLLRHILDRYLLPEELRELCDEHEEPTAGTKAELVERVMVIEDFDPAEAVEYLDHRELVEVSGEIGLPTDGTRDELLDRVLARVTGNASS
ncbi:MAG: SAP domain-containing protein [Thermoplasmata archaeon]